MKIYHSHLSDFAQHKELRCGLGLVQFQSVINELINHQTPNVKLGQILSLEYGSSLTEEERSGEGFPVVGSNGIVGYHDEYIVEGPCIVVGRKGSAGEVNYIEENCFPIDTTFYVKLRTDHFNLKFLFHLLRLLKLQRLALFKGVPGLNRFDAYEARIPLIPKSLQDKIVEQIELIEHDIKLSQSRIKNTLEIVNDVFAYEFGFDSNLWKDIGKQMTAGTQKSNQKEKQIFEGQFIQFATSPMFRFSSRFHNPTSKKLLEILSKLRPIKVKQITTEPIHRGKQPYTTEAGSIYAIKTAHLKNLFIDLKNCEFVSEEFYEKNLIAQVKKGDILLASTGKVSLGKIDYVDFEEDAVVDGHISIIRLDETQYNPLFFTYFFRCILGAFQIERDFTGTTNQIELYNNEIGNFLIPSITPCHQKKIAKDIREELRKQDDLAKQQIKPKLEEIDSIIGQAIHTATITGEKHLENV